jgi:hypothetical protein
MRTEDQIRALRAERDASIAHMLKQGITYERCATLAGVSVSKVVQVAKAFGLERRKLAMLDPVPEGEGKILGPDEVMAVLGAVEITAEEAKGKKQVKIETHPMTIEEHTVLGKPCKSCEGGK